MCTHRSHIQITYFLDNDRKFHAKNIENLNIVKRIVCVCACVDQFAIFLPRGLCCCNMSVRLSVRLSICLSHASILSNHINNFITVRQSLHSSFSIPNGLVFWLGPPKRGRRMLGGMKNRDFRPVSRIIIIIIVFFYLGNNKHRATVNVECEYETVPKL